MAVRFDIDKYNKVRDSYLAYIRVGKIDALLSPLYDTYKVYWQNDPEVKAAEKALKERREQEEEESWRIKELRKELWKEKLQREQEAKQKLAETKAKLRSRFSRCAPNVTNQNQSTNRATPTEKLSQRYAARNKKIAASGHDHFFDVTPPPLEGRFSMIAKARTANKPIKHRSVWTISGGLPSLGKRH